MANFNGLVLTTAGANLQDKIAVRGIALQFMRAAVGDGVWPQGTDPAALTGLKSEKMTLPIQGLADTGDGQHRISLQMTNDGLTEGFLVREIGVFADDPDQGEILYQVAYAEQPDYLPPDGGATHIEMATNLLVATSSAANVTAIMDGSLVFAHVTDLAEHADTFRGFAFSGRHEQYTGDLDAITRNSLYAISRDTVQHAPADMPAGVQGFVHSMVQPDGESRTQLIWSVDDADHPGWWRRRLSGEWGAWRVVGSGDGVPVGAIMPMAGRATPAGYLRCNGAPFLCNAFPQLAEALYCGDELNPTAAFGYRFTDTANPSGSRAMDGAYMLLPEMRGEFVRGLDEERWVDVGREHGSGQGDEFKSHTHGTNIYNDGVGGSGRDVGWVYDSNVAEISTKATGGSETRPRNVAFPYVIKAFGAALNASYVDMAALASEVARIASGSGQGSGIPVGTVLWVPGTTPLAGMLAINDGTSVSRTTWPQLWEYAQNSGLLITEAEWQAQAAAQSSVGYFSDGDGSTTFRLPRIVDYLRGADPMGGRYVGVWQGDAFQDHGHELWANQSSSGGTRWNAASTHLTSYAANHNRQGGDARNAIENGQGTPRVGPETRPKSINWLPCIQAASVPVYSGTVDMLSLASEVAGKVDRSEWQELVPDAAWRMPNGLILQHGTYNNGDVGYADVVFAAAFPVACFIVLPIDSDSVPQALGITNMTTTGFRVTGDAIGRYLALGR